MRKTHAMRSLDAKGIEYRAVEYDTTEAFHTGEEAANLVGVPAEFVYKTMVVIREGSSRGKPVLVMIPVSSQIDLKLLAQGLGEKKLRMATQKEAEKLTGLQVGGISALALRHPQQFEVLIDERAGLLERIHVSAGERGVDLEIAVKDLTTVTNARIVRAAQQENLASGK
jgi:Cys-tRNA(Pro)/Cys-tRNA(Cys) deacylase